jgi:hypothetical protein
MQGLAQKLGTSRITTGQSLQRSGSRPHLSEIVAEQCARQTRASFCGPHRLGSARVQRQSTSAGATSSAAIGRSVPLMTLQARRVSTTHKCWIKYKPTKSLLVEELKRYGRLPASDFKVAVQAATPAVPIWDQEVLHLSRYQTNPQVDIQQRFLSLLV